MNITKYNEINKENMSFTNALFNYPIYESEYLAFIYIRRFNYFNANQIPQIKQVTLTFKSLNLATTLNLSLIANFFFLKFFTGKKPYFLPVKVISTFKKKIYHCICTINLKKKNNFFFLGTRLNYASNALSTIDFQPFDKIFEKKNNYTFLLKNFNYINIVETHPVFFKWQENLELNLTFSKELSRLEYIIFFKLLKFNEDKFLL